MVVIAIIAIIVVVAVPSYNDYSNNQKLAEAVNQLQAVLRHAQNNAQTGTVCKDDSRALYWRIDISSDPSLNTFYSLSPVCEGGSQPAVETDLSAGVIVSNVAIVPVVISGSTTPCNVAGTLPLQVKFNNITSNISFNDPNSPRCVDETNSNLEITLSSSGNTRKVVVEKGGGIYVKNQ
jgi:type II secretory pathway pseudopilin PulG